MNLSFTLGINNLLHRKILVTMLVASTPDEFDLIKEDLLHVLLLGNRITIEENESYDEYSSFDKNNLNCFKNLLKATPIENNDIHNQHELIEIITSSFAKRDIDVYLLTAFN